MRPYKMEKLILALCSSNVFMSFSLDQLLVSPGDQQRLQSVLSSVGSKSTVLALIQEAKAQSEVSEMQQTQEDGTAVTSVLPVRHELREPRTALFRVSCCEFCSSSLVGL